MNGGGRSTNDEPFELVSVERSAAPDGSAEDDWFSYRIRQGINAITGYRQGSLAAVEASLQETVDALNERRAPRRGRVQLRKTSKAGKTSG